MKRWNHSFLYSIYVFVLLPLLIILPFSVFSTMYFKNFYEDSLQNRYADHLESIYSKTEIHLESITKNVQFLEGDQQFMEAMRGNGSAADIRHAQYQLRQFEAKYPLIGSAYILDKNKGEVYTKNGTDRMQDFFGEKHCYAEYDLAYWQSYRGTILERQILTPSAIGESGMVMPVVYGRVGEAYTNNLLVIDVSLDYIFDEMAKNNAEFSPINGMVSRYTGNWYGSDGTSREMPTDFIRKLMTNGLSVFDYDLEGTDAMVVSYCPNHSILGYAYVTGIPRSVINYQVYKIIWVLVLAWVIIFLISFLVIRFSAKKLYAPIRSLLDLISRGDGHSVSRNDDFSYIQNFIRQSMQMRENYIPIVQENLLLNFLRGETEEEAVETTEAAFAENGLVFRYPDFCIVFLRLRPTAQYYKIYPQVTYENMAKKLLDVLIPCFPESYDVYNLTFATDTMCIVLNVQEETDEREVQAALRQFSDYLAPDKETIQMRVSVGGIYSGIGGMKKSYEEALESFEGLTVDPGTGKTEERKRKPHIFGDAEEAVLTNYLLAGQVQPAREYINHLLLETKERGESPSFVYNLYVRLSNTVLNVMRLRRIPFEGNAIDDIDIPERFYNLLPEELRGEIEKMLDAIEGKLAVNKIRIEEVIDDIQQHYTEDIRLDELAEKYHTSPPYLSRILKDGLGMTFIDYVARLRVQRAKELLEKTDKSIAEIGELSGFVNPSSFTRVFKSHIGVSPSQYRKSSKT